jgi:radical SAM protein with 4Fe4S-binding SPASM domain
VIQLHDFLEARAASLHEERDGKHLFVWGEVGQWLAIDDEAAILLQCFTKKCRVESALREYSRKTRKHLEDATREALPVIGSLVERGILGSPPAPPAPLEDKVRISNLTFNITNRCNLRCPWCYNPRYVDDEIPVPDLVNWLATGGDALDRDAAFIILGGEPFLDEPRLIETVRSVRERLAGEILVSTNGTRLSDGTPGELVKANATVQISLDSPRVERHDSVRGSGVFEQALSTARLLIDAGVHIVLSMVMTRQSEREIEAYFDLATRIGAKEVRFIPLRRIGPGADQSGDVPDLYECFRRLVAIVQRRPDFAKLLGRDFFSILMAVCRFSRLRGNCGIARRCLFVDANGDIFPCPNHRGPDHQCGNVRTTPLGEVVESSSVLEDMRGKYCLENMPTCAQCDFRFWCAGDCRAEALSTTGSPGAPSPYCDAIKKIVTEIFWLMADGWQGLGSRERDIAPWS